MEEQKTSAIATDTVISTDNIALDGAWSAVTANLALSNYDSTASKPYTVAVDDNDGELPRVYEHADSDNQRLYGSATFTLTVPTTAKLNNFADGHKIGTLTFSAEGQAVVSFDNPGYSKAESTITWSHTDLFTGGIANDLTGIDLYVVYDSAGQTYYIQEVNSYDSTKQKAKAAASDNTLSWTVFFAIRNAGDTAADEKDAHAGDKLVAVFEE